MTDLDMHNHHNHLDNNGLLNVNSTGMLTNITLLRLPSHDPLNTINIKIREDEIPAMNVLSTTSLTTNIVIA